MDVLINHEAKKSTENKSSSMASKKTHQSYMNSLQSLGAPPQTHAAHHSKSTFTHKSPAFINKKRLSQITIVGGGASISAGDKSQPQFDAF